jgi:ComF family protein
MELQNTAPTNRGTGWALRTLAEQFRRGYFFLREYLFPFGCGMCGTGLAGMDETWYGLCKNCRAHIGRGLSAPAGHCAACGRPLISEQDRCLSCRNSAGNSLDQVRVLFPYTGAYRALLRAYKFGKHTALGNFFAEKIQAALERFVQESAAAGAVQIVPVPPRPGKIKKTGWDQIEYLAKLLETGPGRTGTALTVNRCLKRLPSKTQKELDREGRLKNLRDKIRLVRPAPRTAVIVDDVITTGATLDACAAALKAGGTERVWGICLFYD